MRILTAAFALLLIFVVPAAAGKRIALVIGNKDYDHVIDLKNPGNDADLMEQTLRDVGFEVSRYNDLDQRGMKQAMLEFGRKLKEGAEASMFYYAGHGVEIGGVNYLVPRDADLKSSEEADIQNVSVNSFLALTENSSVPLNIVILDACRNNPFRSLRASSSGGLAPVKAPRGTYVAYATSPGAVAVDGTENNSPFTLALSESIKQPGLTLEAVLKLTRSKVQTITAGAQLPFDSSAITGEFYFVPVVSESPAATPPADAPKLFQLDTAQEAYEAAGNDPDLLRIVADKFADTIWGSLAVERLKKLTPAKPVVETPPETPAVETTVQQSVDEPETEPTVVQKPRAASSPPANENPVPAATPTPKKKLVVKVPRYETPTKSRTNKPAIRKTVRVYTPPIKPKRKVVAIVTPKVKRVVVAPKPVARVSLSCGATGALQRGVMCKNQNGQVCRVGAVRFGRGGGKPILFGCR